MVEEEPPLYKILLLGDSTVGKTCFLLRYTDDTFLDVHMATIGLDYRLKTMILNDQKIVLNTNKHSKSPFLNCLQCNILHKIRLNGYI